MGQAMFTVAASRRHSKIKSEMGFEWLSHHYSTPHHSLVLTAPHPRTSWQGHGTLMVATSCRHSKGVESESGLDWTASHHRSTTQPTLLSRLCREIDLGEEH